MSTQSKFFTQAVRIKYNKPQQTSLVDSRSGLGLIYQTLIFSGWLRIIGECDENIFTLYGNNDYSFPGLMDVSKISYEDVNNDGLFLGAALSTDYECVLGKYEDETVCSLDV